MSMCENWPGTPARNPGAALEQAGTPSTDAGNARPTADSSAPNDWSPELDDDEDND